MEDSKLQRLLVPLDGTAISEAGLRWAVATAYRSGCGLRLITVVPDASEAPRAEEYLQRTVASIRPEVSAVSFDVIRGDPIEMLLRESATADMTVLTSGTVRWFASEVLDGVLQSMSGPVVVVRGDRGHSIGGGSLDRILLPLSETNYSSEVLPAAVTMALAVKGKITLFQNVEDPEARGLPVVMTRSMKLRLHLAEQYVDECADLIRVKGIEVETLVSCGNHVMEIVNAARSIGAGVIAMATRGRDRMDRRITGSVANAVLETSTVACLVVRAGHTGAQPAESAAASQTPMAAATVHNVAE